jgi:hypothetical protein
MQGALFGAAVMMTIVTFIAGPDVARTLLANSSFPRASKCLNYYCRHIKTIYGFSLCVCCLVSWSSRVGVFFTVMNTALSLPDVAVVRKAGINSFRFPSTSLFSVVSTFGFFGLLVE